MGLGLFLAFFLIYHVPPLSVSAEGDGKSATCPKNNYCGDLAGHTLTSFDSSHPSDCGFCMLDCKNGIAFEYPPEKWFSFNADENIGDTGIKLQDNELEPLLRDRRCKSFLHNISFPNSPFISYSIVPNITLYRCTGDQDKRQTQAYGSRNHSKCDDFTVYYQHPGEPRGQEDSEGAIQINCTVVTLPMVPEAYLGQYLELDLFELLTADFHLEWRLSEHCKSCRNGGPMCRTDWSQLWHSLCAKEGKNKKLVILCTVTPVSAFMVLVLALLFIWYRKKKKSWTLNFISRNTSEPSANPDLEGGSVYFGVPVFSYCELEEATNNFDASKELGDGGFGTVYFGKLRDGREVAVKRLYEHNFKRMEQFINEIEILTRLRHPNLVTLYGCTSRRSRELLLVYEYIPNGTVADHLHGDRAEDKYLTWQHRMNIAVETADALAYLHKSDIIHRDVKTNNILLDHNFCVKVADFGLSRLFPTDVSHISTAPQGTPGYVDPEYHQCYQLTDKSDVYSFGVVLIELISSMPAVDISRHRHEVNLANLAINRIQRCAFDELIDPSLGYKSDTEVLRMTTSVAELAFRCLQLEKDMRPKMDEVLETLKEIQNWRDTLIDKTTETDEKSVESKRAKVASPESEDIVLLKNVNCPSSPNSVADAWVSSSSTTSTSR